MVEQNVLGFKLELSHELLTAHAGLVTAHEFHLGLGLARLLDEALPRPGSGRGHRPSEVVMPVLLMLLGGGRDLADIEVLGKDRALREAAGTVRWRLYQVAARLVRHARRVILKVAADATTFGMLSDLRFAARSMAFP